MKLFKFKFAQAPLFLQIWLSWTWTWIRIRIQKNCWIRIRLKWMRIHSPDLNFCLIWIWSLRWQDMQWLCVKNFFFFLLTLIFIFQKLWDEFKKEMLFRANFLKMIKKPEIRYPNLISRIPNLVHPYTLVWRIYFWLVFVFSKRSHGPTTTTRIFSVCQVTSLGKDHNSGFSKSELAMLVVGAILPLFLTIGHHHWTHTHTHKIYKWFFSGCSCGPPTEVQTRLRYGCANWCKK